MSNPPVATSLSPVLESRFGTHLASGSFLCCEIATWVGMASSFPRVTFPPAHGGLRETSVSVPRSRYLPHSIHSLMPTHALLGLGLLGSWALGLLGSWALGLLGSWTAQHVERVEEEANEMKFKEVVFEILNHTTSL